MQDLSGDDTKQCCGVETRSVPEPGRMRLRRSARAVRGLLSVAVTFQFLILLVASWIGRRQGEAIEYLRAENRVLRARLGHERLRFADAERRLLAQKGKPLGRKLLAEVASLATPETVLRWYREQVAAKYDGSRTRGTPGRPPAVTDGKIAMQRPHVASNDRR